MSKKSIKSDVARIDRQSDQDIDYSDIPALGPEFFAKTAVAWPAAKSQLTIRLDVDVLGWLKSFGKGYQPVPCSSCGQVGFGLNDAIGARG